MGAFGCNYELGTAALVLNEKLLRYMKRHVGFFSLLHSAFNCEFRRVPSHMKRRANSYHRIELCLHEVEIQQLPEDFFRPTGQRCSY